MVRAIQSLDFRKSEVQDFPLTISKTVNLRVPSQVNDFLIITWHFRLRGCRRQVDLLASACLASPSRRLGRESTGLGLFVLQVLSYMRQEQRKRGFEGTQGRTEESSGDAQN